MSAFLGPIHFWLYNKIQLQQEIVEEIIKVGEEFAPGLRQELDEKYDVTGDGPLEEVIDKMNIHGWLQSNITQTEYKLAFSVTSLLEKNSDFIQEIKAIFKNKGIEKSSLITENSAAQAYKVINDSLLDGMPCDHANSVIDENDDKVMWKRNSCVHKNYWEEIGGSVSIYYSLREEFIKGILAGTDLEYEKIDDATSCIKKREE